MKRTSLTVAVSVLALAASAWSAAPAGAATGSGTGHHGLRPRTSTAASGPAVITGAMTDHGGPVQTAPQVYVD